MSPAAGVSFGAALASGFAAAGARVVISDHDEQTATTSAADIRECGGTAVAARCDIMSEPDVRAVVDLAVETYDALDVLVNNVGINIPKPAEQLTLAEWSRVVGINLTGTFLYAQVGGAVMLR